MKRTPKDAFNFLNDCIDAILVVNSLDRLEFSYKGRRYTCTYNAMPDMSQIDDDGRHKEGIGWTVTSWRDE